MNKLTKTILRSDDLSCPSCVTAIEAALNRLDGVENARVHFATGRIEVAYDADVVNDQILIEVVRQTGHESRVSPGNFECHFFTVTERYY